MTPSPALRPNKHSAGADPVAFAWGRSLASQNQPAGVFIRSTPADEGLLTAVRGEKSAVLRDLSCRIRFCSGDGAPKSGRSDCRTGTRGHVHPRRPPRPPARRGQAGGLQFARQKVRGSGTIGSRSTRSPSDWRDCDGTYRDGWLHLADVRGGEGQQPRRATERK